MRPQGLAIKRKMRNERRKKEKDEPSHFSSFFSFFLPRQMFLIGLSSVGASGPLWTTDPA